MDEDILAIREAEAKLNAGRPAIPKEWSLPEITVRSWANFGLATLVAGVIGGGIISAAGGVKQGGIPESKAQMIHPGMGADDVVGLLGRPYTSERESDLNREGYSSGGIGTSAWILSDGRKLLVTFSADGFVESCWISS